MVRKIMLLFAILAAVLPAVPVVAEEAAPLPTKKEKISYSLGYDLIRNLNKHNAEIDIDVLIQGIRDAGAGVPPPVAEIELRKVATAFQAELARKDVLLRRATLVTNHRKGEEFLAANKLKEGIVALPSGLQYRILKTGDGRKPVDGNTTEIVFRVLHIDGTEAMRSEPGKARSFLIPQRNLLGLSEALKLMPAGSKWELFLPSRLAYGEKGNGLDVEPNEALIIELELIGIK